MRILNMNEFAIDILEIDENGTIWMVIKHKGVLIFKEPLAQAFRTFLDSKNLDQGEHALLKLKLLRHVEQEIMRA